MPEPTLDWSTAEVKDSKLTVQIEGDVPDGWEDTFKATAKLLGGGSWGEITLEEQKAEVSGVTPGSEEKLKHFLESVLLQANSTHSSDEEDEEEQGEDGGDEGQAEDEEESESDEDKEMAERFRSFADDKQDEGSRDDEESEGDESGDGESEGDESGDGEAESEKSKAEKS